jgi:hypothetical protein
VTTIARIVCFFPSLLATIDLDAGGVKGNANSRSVGFGGRRAPSFPTAASGYAVRFKTSTSAVEALAVNGFELKRSPPHEVEFRYASLDPSR